jgi:hypothetical protein
MTEAVVAFGALVLALAVQAGGLLIWGASLTQRVRRLEDEVKPLKLMPEKIAVVAERMDSLIEQFRDLNAAIRWMRDPVLDTVLNPRRKD